jgi:type IV pilus assembly protein PilC
MTEKKENKLDSQELPKAPEKKKGFDLSFLTADIGKEKQYLFENIALMLAGGLNILDILVSIESELKSTKVKAIVRKMHDEIKNGEPIWRALESSDLLSSHLLSIIRIGEESGRLPENLQIVIEQKERDADFRAKIRSASLYPGLVLVLMTLIGLGMGIFILPRLAGIYDNLQVDLPWITKVMIGFGNFMGQYGFIVGPVVLLALFGGIYGLFINKKTNHIGQSILFKIPIIRRLIQEVELSRLGYLLGTLVEAGIPPVDALNLLADSTGLRAYAKMYKGWVDHIKDGFTFHETFNKVETTDAYLPLYPRQAITTGEQTGTLATSLRKIGEIYLKRNEHSTQDLSVVLEPVLLLIVWLGVAFIAFSVVLPIYSLVGDITQATQNQGREVDPSDRDEERIDELIEQGEEDGFTPNNLESVGLVVIVGSESVDIYDDIGGAIIDQASQGEVYEYNRSEQGWYLLLDNTEIVGWVDAQYVQTQ